jgi:hypothetical protein
MSLISGWGRGTWGEYTWGEPIPVDVTGSQIVSAIGSAVADVNQQVDVTGQSINF